MRLFKKYDSENLWNLIASLSHVHKMIFSSGGVIDDSEHVVNNCE